VIKQPAITGCNARPHAIKFGAACSHVNDGGLKTYPAVKTVFLLSVSVLKATVLVLVSCLPSQSWVRVSRCWKLLSWWCCAYRLSLESRECLGVESYCPGLGLVPTVSVLSLKSVPVLKATVLVVLCLLSQSWVSRHSWASLPFLSSFCFFCKSATDSSTDLLLSTSTQQRTITFTLRVSKFTLECVRRVVWSTGCHTIIYQPQAISKVTT